MQNSPLIDLWHEKFKRKIFRKINLSYPLIRTCSCTYQGVRNISFPENFAKVLYVWSPMQVGFVFWFTRKQFVWSFCWNTLWKFFLTKSYAKKSIKFNGCNDLFWNICIIFMAKQAKAGRKYRMKMEHLTLPQN